MPFSDWSARLTVVGATANELSAISASYQSTAGPVQGALDTLIAAISNTELLVMLTTWRGNPGPFQQGFPGGGLPFGTGVALLTGSTADDAYPISAGTGQKMTSIPVPDLPATVELTTRKDVADGYAGLDASALLKVAEIPPSVVQDLSLFDAVRYGAKIDGVTDDTAAWQAAIDAAFAAGGGLPWSSKPGVSLINGPQITGTAQGYNYSGQLLLPANAFTNGRVVDGLAGPLPAAMTQWQVSPGMPPSTSGLVLLSNATSGSIVDAIPAFTASGTPLTNLHFFSRNVTLRAPNGPTVNCLNLAAVASVDLEKGSCDVNATAGNAVSLPVGTPQTTLSGTLSVNTAITSLPVAAIPTALPSGTVVIVSSGTNSQPWVLTANAALNATALTVGLATPNFAYPSGSAVGTASVGLKLPRINNSAFVRVQDWQVIGYSVGVDASEHAVLDNVTIQQTIAGLQPNAASGHEISVRKLLIQQAVIPIHVPNVGNGGGRIEGTIDIECFTTGAFASLGALISDPGARLFGNPRILLSTAPTSGFGVNGAGALNYANVNAGGRGWFANYPYDTFTRMLDQTGSLGCCDQTGNPWAINSGTWKTNAGKAQWVSGGAATATVRYYDQLGRGIAGSRLIRTIIKTGATAYDIGQIIGRSLSSGNYLYVRLQGGLVKISKRVSSTDTVLATSGAGVVAANTQYDVRAVCSFPGTPGASQTITVYVGTTQVVTYTLVAQDITDMADTTPDAALGIKTDGLWAFSDDNLSEVSLFQVIPLAATA